MSVSVTVEWGDRTRGVVDRVQCWVDSDDDVREVVSVLESRRSDPPEGSCSSCGHLVHGQRCTARYGVGAASPTATVRALSHLAGGGMSGHAPRRQEAKCRHCHRDIIRLPLRNWFHEGGREDCGLVAKPAFSDPVTVPGDSATAPALAASAPRRSPDPAVGTRVGEREATAAEAAPADRVVPPAGAATGAPS